MRHRVTTLFVILAVLAPAAFARAGQLSVRDAIRIALTDNPVLRAHTFSIDAQEHNVKAAKGFLYPKVAIEEKFSRTDNPTYGFMATLNLERFTPDDFLIDTLNDPADISDFETSIRIEQALFVPRLHTGIDISERELDAKKAEYKRMKADIVRRVIGGFLAVQTSRDYLTVARTSVKDAEEHRRLSSVRYETGTGLYSDVLRADVAIKNAEARVVEAESSLDVARRALALVLGRTEPVEVTNEKVHLPFDDLSVYLEASAERQDLKALHHRHANSLDAVKLEKSFFLPEIGMAGSYNLHDENDPLSSSGESYYFMGFLRWNLVDVSSYYRIREARARAYGVGARLEGLQDEIRFQIHRAYTRVREKERHLELARAVVAEAEEALRLLRLRYENALAPIVDLLDTQVVRDRSEAGRVRAENDYIESLVELYYQSGMLLGALDSE